MLQVGDIPGERKKEYWLNPEEHIFYGQQTAWPIKINILNLDDKLQNM